MSAPDAWDGSDVILDQSACPICLKETCEGHDDDSFDPGPVPPDIRTDDLDIEAPPEPIPALTFVPASEVIETPRPVEIVEGIAYADRVTVMVSESGVGKTFVGLDIVAAVSADIPWHGRDVHHGSVAYISFEGDALGLRLRALREAAGHRLEHVYVLHASDPLSPIVDRDRVELPSRGETTVSAALSSLAATLTATNQPAITLVVIDTVRASLSGSEDSSEHVSGYLRAVRRLMTHVPGAGVILAHHSGWQDGESKRKRERGSSALRGNVDCTLYLEAGEYDAERGECPLTLRTLKVRDAERPAPLRLIRRRVDLNEEDRHGQPVTSCIIERDRRTREDSEAEQLETVQADQRITDRKILGILRDHPDATSQHGIREYAGLSHGVVVASIARILRAEWAIPPEKRQLPYTVTDAGRAELESL